MSSTHRLHPHHTGRTELDAVALAEPLAKACSSCNVPLSPYEKPPFHCRNCDYTVCKTCDKPRSHPVHPTHELYLITPLSSWRCEVCKSASTTVQELQCYKCETCNFYLCKKCLIGVNNLLHQHTLYRTDVRYVYHQSNGEWSCDICRNNNGPGHYYPAHCKTCQFDVCDNCVKPWRSTAHAGHAMFKADSKLVYPTFNGGWRCDRCSQHFTPEQNNIPFHCSQCEYDLCSSCMQTTSEESNAVGFDMPRSFFEEMFGSGTRSGIYVPVTNRGNPIASPTEETNREKGRPGAPDGSDCVICLERPKDATIVHGSTGHVCCCTACATELQRTRNPVCPICRAPIDRVIKQYTV